MNRFKVTVSEIKIKLHFFLWLFEIVCLILFSLSFFLYLFSGVSHARHAASVCVWIKSFLSNKIYPPHSVNSGMRDAPKNNCTKAKPIIKIKICSSTGHIPAIKVSCIKSARTLADAHRFFTNTNTADTSGSEGKFIGALMSQSSLLGVYQFNISKLDIMKSFTIDYRRASHQCAHSNRILVRTQIE